MSHPYKDRTLNDDDNLTLGSVLALVTESYLIISEDPCVSLNDDPVVAFDAGYSRATHEDPTHDECSALV